MSDAASVPRSSCSPSPASAASRVSAPPARSSASPPPPSPEASSGAGGDKFDLKTARWRHKLDECIQKPSAETSMQRAERMFKTPYIVSIIVFFVALVLLLMEETGKPDRAKARPLPLLKAYGRLLRSQHFMASSLVIATSTGSLYALASILPFVMINLAGLTPSQFGIGMLMQTGCYFSGSVVFRIMLRWFTSKAQVAFGLSFVGIGAVALAISTEVLPISYLSVMLPVGCFAFGIAFLIPYITNAALLPFPDIAGSASAMMGFMQMGSGLVTGMIAALLGSPILAMQIMVPAMGAIAVACYLWLRLIETREPASPEIREPAEQPAAGDDWSEAKRSAAADK